MASSRSRRPGAGRDAADTDGPYNSGMKQFVPLVMGLLALPAAAASVGRYIVALRPVATRPAELRDRPARALRAIDAYAADLSADEVAALRRSKDVRYVEPVVE